MSLPLSSIQSDAIPMLYPAVHVPEFQVQHEDQRTLAKILRDLALHFRGVDAIKSTAPKSTALSPELRVLVAKARTRCTSALLYL